MSTAGSNHFYAAIRDIEDFPQPGIVFKDITPLLLDADLFGSAVERMVEALGGENVEKVMAIESRGFLFGAPIARALGAGLILARKPGKLPWKTHTIEYALEYGTDTLQIHEDSIEPGDRVIIVDDVLATGGTARAAADLVRMAGGRVAGTCFLIELEMLAGRLRLGSDVPVWRLMSYPRPA